MGKLSKEVSRLSTLESAWRKVRDNGRLSKSAETKGEIERFDDREGHNLRVLQRQLATGKFKFAPQKGVAKKKPNSNKRRPLVLAPVENRIVQRAILEVLQAQVPKVRQILTTPTSIGGVPGRGTRHAIALVNQEIEKGARFFVRSDIEAFFTKIPRGRVVDFVASFVSDTELVDLFRAATTTELFNLEQLGEHRDLFPIGDKGVAQGSPLSPLMGNIILNEFDRKLNGRGILCIRYIDDFLLLGKSEKNVSKAFESANAMLGEFDMQAYSPWVRSDKAEAGDVMKGFTFLGCELQPRLKLVVPSRKARQALLEKVDQTLNDGRREIKAALAGIKHSHKHCYAQTLVQLDRILYGWGHAFAFCNGRQPMQELDTKVSSMLAKYQRDVLRNVDRAAALPARRALGVFPLSDTPVIEPITKE